MNETETGTEVASLVRQATRIDLSGTLKKESESNDILILFAEFSNVHNNDGSSDASQSKLSHKISWDQDSFVQWLQGLFVRPGAESRLWSP